MSHLRSFPSYRLAAAATATLASLGAAVALAGAPAQAASRPKVVPGDLMVSRLHYDGTATPLVPGVTTLPTGGTAVAGSDFAHVWDNVSVDANFGVSAPIFLD